MSESTVTAPDLVRWTFAIEPDRRGAIEGHLEDLGADVLVRDGRTFLVTWDEPEVDLEAVIEALWALHETPFEVTQEEFHRTSLDTLAHEAA